MQFCVLALLVSGVAVPQAQPPEALLKEALAQHQAGNLDAAIANYREFLKVQPRSLPARGNLGAALARLGRLDEAIAEYRKALEIDPANPALHLNLGLAFFKEARLDDAVAEFDLVRAKQPGNKQVLLLSADSYLRLGENKKVIDLLTPLDAREPNDRAVSYLLGTALIRENDVARGQVIINRVMKDGESPEALMLIGASQFAAQDNKAALRTLSRAIELKPELPGLQALYGQAKLNDGDPAGAKEAFLAELKLNPLDYDSNLNLGALCRIEKNWEDAAKYLYRARQIRPRSIALKYQLGNLEVGLGNIEKGRRMLEEVTREAPDFIEGHVSLATVYYRLKRKEDGDRERATVGRLNEEAQKKELKKR
jgi:tetratricopeptide (TPR) repeat protein